MNPCPETNDSWYPYWKNSPIVKSLPQSAELPAIVEFSLHSALRGHLLSLCHEDAICGISLALGAQNLLIAKFPSPRHGQLWGSVATHVEQPVVEFLWHPVPTTAN